MEKNYLLMQNIRKKCTGLFSYKLRCITNVDYLVIVEIVRLAKILEKLIIDSSLQQNNSLMLIIKLIKNIYITKVYYFYQRLIGSSKEELGQQNSIPLTR